MVPADSRRISRVPRYSGYRYALACFGYRPVTVCGATFQMLLLTIEIRQRGPTTPNMRCHMNGLGSSPVARHYWGNHYLFSLPGGTKMFQFPPFASMTNMSGIPDLQTGGLSHSEICGSRDICSLPQLIAAYHVLHRLREPRHPPCALFYFLIRNTRNISSEQLILSAVKSEIVFCLPDRQKRRGKDGYGMTCRSSKKNKHGIAESFTVLLVYQYVKDHRRINGISGE